MKASYCIRIEPRVKSFFIQDVYSPWWINTNTHTQSEHNRSFSYIMIKVIGKVRKSPSKHRLSSLFKFKTDPVAQIRFLQCKRHIVSAGIVQVNAFLSLHPTCKQPAEHTTWWTHVLKSISMLRLLFMAMCQKNHHIPFNILRRLG